MMTTAEAVRLQNATCCPSCGRAKECGRSLCRECMIVLPPHVRDALLFAKREKLAPRYEEAIRCAVQRRQSASVVNAGRHTR